MVTNVSATGRFTQIAFWFAGEVGCWTPAGRASESPGGLAWAALWLLVFVHASGTLSAAMTYLRPPNQALRADVDYSLGVYETEGDSPFRFTRRRSVTVLQAVKPWMKLTLGVNQPDLAKKPVDVKIWVNQKLTVRTQLTSIIPIVRYIPVGDGGKRMMLETWVSRVDRPSDRGENDSRELGLLVSWNFLDAPPPDSVIGDVR